MAKRQVVTGAMIIAAGAVSTAASATQTPSAWTGSVDRGAGEPAVSSILRLDEDITALGGLHGNKGFVTVATLRPDTAFTGPIIVNPGDSLTPRADSLNKPPPGVIPGQDTVLRPPVVPRSQRRQPRGPAPGGPNKP